MLSGKANHSTDFLRGFKESRLELILASPKSDLHNHSALGSRLSALSDWAGIKLPPAPPLMADLDEMNTYITTVLRPLFLERKSFEYAIEAAYLQAIADGVKRLEMSVDCYFATLYPDKEEGMLHFLSGLHEKYKERIDSRPELGLSRDAVMPDYKSWAERLLETRFFRSLDLYGGELAREPEYFAALFRKAASLGMKKKAHVGEFGTAESVRHTVEVLELDAIQHGIAAATSPEIMKWLRLQAITLNVCPTSNIALSRVPDMKVHPIRILVDHGVKVTINTDDLMIFGQSVSDEYLNLYRSGLLSAEELDTIRVWGLTEGVTQGD